MEVAFARCAVFGGQRLKAPRTALHRTAVSISVTAGDDRAVQLKGTTEGRETATLAPLTCLSASRQCALKPLVTGALEQGEVEARKRCESLIRISL